MPTILSQTLTTDHAFETHVTRAASLAQTCMTSDNGRISRAVELVLAGCVQEDGSGRWSVASATAFPERWYVIYNGGCNCKDYAAHAVLVPHYVCKHLIATAIYQRAMQALEQEEIMFTDEPCPTAQETPALDRHPVAPTAPPVRWGSLQDLASDWPVAEPPGQSPGQAQDAGLAAVEVDAIAVDVVTRWKADAVQATLPAVPSLPEAPCSANCYILIHGHKVQLTIRGFTEADVLQRMSAVLADYAPAPGK